MIELSDENVATIVTTKDGFSETDFKAYDFPEKIDGMYDITKARLKNLLQDIKAIPIEDAYGYFDRNDYLTIDSLFPAESKIRLHYLFLAPESINSESKYTYPFAHDTEFYIDFFNSFYEPTRKTDYAMEDDMPEVLSTVGFNYRRNNGGDIFYEIDQFQGAKFGKPDDKSDIMFKRVKKDLPIKWVDLGTHIIEQLAYFENKNLFGSKVRGIFINSADHRLTNLRLKYHTEKTGADSTTTKRQRIIKSRGYMPFQFDDAVKPVMFWKPIEEIKPDNLFQSFLVKSSKIPLTTIK